MFVWPTFTQTVVALCNGLDAAWRFFGGVVQWIIPDNMAAAVMRAHPTEPQLNRSFAEYAQARGCFVDLARARHPKDKPRVENQVPYVHERWFAGESFAMALREIQLHAEFWCRDIAGARIHGTTRQIPRDLYEREEHARMLPAPQTPFDVPVWTKAKIHPDHHAQVARGLYSLPTRFIGETLDVRVDSSRVRFYVGAEVVKSHARVAPGQRSTDENDYPVEKAGYAFRSVDKVKAQAKERGEHIGVFADRLLSGALPWTKMRQAYALLRLCDKFGAARVNSTCASALAFDVIDVPRIERMLKSAHKAEESPATTGRVARLPEGRFARDRSSFAMIDQSSIVSEKGGDR